MTDAGLRAAGIDDLEVQRMPFGPNPSWVPRTRLPDVVALLPHRPQGAATGSAGQDE